MQALILAGGEGTRLQPLTSTMPKPVVPLVGRPFIAYMLEWLRGYGVDEAILSCGFMADDVRAVLGDGASLGISLRYVEEPRPLGTGGALKFAEGLLDKRFFMLNGDVLTDIDLSQQMRQHERTGARVTLALIGVEDPSGYGLVRRRADLAVAEFVEKPSPDEIQDTDLVSAGAYIIEREVLSELTASAGRISIERELFPALVDRGLFGYEARGYWLDIGTPQRYLQATFDILDGEVQTQVGRRLRAAGGALRQGEGEARRRQTAAGGALPEGEGEGVVHAPALIGPECTLAADAIVGGRTVLGAGVSIGRGAHVQSSVLLDGCQIGAESRIDSAILGPGATIGEQCRLSGGVVLGENVTVGAGNALARGMRIFPGVNLPAGAIAF